MLLGSVDLCCAFLQRLGTILARHRFLSCDKPHKKAETQQKMVPKRCPSGSNRRTLHRVMAQLFRTTKLQSPSLVQSSPI